MTTKVTEAPVTRLFTFGYGQACPFTGEDLGDHYALVTAPDASSAKLLMSATFGRNWAFEYDGPTDPKIVDYVPRMTLHAHLSLVPQQPMPSGFEYVQDPTGRLFTREADDPTPVSPGHMPLHFGAMVDGDELVDETPPASEAR